MPAIGVQERREGGALELPGRMQRRDLMILKVAEESLEIGDREAQLQEVVTLVRNWFGQIGGKLNGKVQAAEPAGIVFVPAAVFLFLEWQAKNIAIKRPGVLRVFRQQEDNR
jgi:hypothetical protein